MELPSPPPPPPLLDLEPSGCPRRREIEATASATVSPPMSSRHAFPRPSSMPGLSAPLPLEHPSPQPIPPTPTNTCPALLSRPASAPLPDMAIRSSFLDNHDDDDDDGPLRSERVVANVKPANGYTHSASLNTSTTPDATVQSPAVQEPLPPPTSTPIPDLNQISHLLSQAKYHKRRRVQTQRLFHRLQTAASRTQRLAIASRHVRRTLADCLRFEDKHSFAHLFNTFQHACDQSSSPGPAGTQDLEPAIGSMEGLPGDFLEDISSTSRETTIQLLTRLRYDKFFVADRIALLSHRELTALLSDGASARRAESVLGGSQRTSTRSSKPLGFVVDRVVDDISGGGFRSSLETLVHLNSTASPSRSDRAHSRELWAHVAARMISDRKSGGDRLTSALLDIWSHRSDWPGKNRLRKWMLHTLQRGQFLLDQPSRQSFRMRVHGQVDLSAEESVRTEAFYKESVDQLLELLSDPHGPSVIPDAAVDLTMAIHASLGARPDHQKDLPSFVTTRWLFGSFLVDLIILPESHGLLNGHYISEPARLKILKEVAARCQKAVFDVVYAWKHSNVLSADTVERVQKVINRFETSNSQRTKSSSTHPPVSPPSDTDLLYVSATDTVTVMNALFPARRPVSVSSDHDTLRSGMQSSASSMSGFSLFRAADPTGPQWSATTPSSGRLSSPFELGSGGQPYLSNEPQLDLEVMDARSELEEYVAAHGINDGTHWSLLVACNDIEQIESYSRLLDQETTASNGPAHSTAGKESAKLSHSGKAAIESLISSLPQTAVSIGAFEPSTPGSIFALSEQLLTLFDIRIAACEDRHDFVASHTWLSHMEDFEDYIRFHGSDSVALLLLDIEKSAKTSLTTSLSAIARCEEWLEIVRPTLDLASSQLAISCESNKALRTKMWYTADIRTSSAYDNVRAVTSALRVMGKPKRAGAIKSAPPLRHWSGTRLSSQNIHLKSEAQILELLGTNPEYGGPNKLSDDQSKLTLTWLRRNDIQLICAGEERLHKLCMEVRKCVDQVVTPSRQDNPLLWSNALFARDSNDTRPPTIGSTRLFAPEPPHRRFDMLSLQTNPFTTVDSNSNASQTLSSTSSRDYFDRSPTLAARSSTAFWSPAATEVRSPSSTTSVASHIGRGWDTSPQKPNFTSQPPSLESQATGTLREQVTGLLLSDVGATLFVQGSETDEAFFAGLGADLTEKHLASKMSFTNRENSHGTADMHRDNRMSKQRPSFNFEQAFTSMFESFTIECDPYAKLEHLNAIQKLIRPYLARRDRCIDALVPDEDTSSKLLQSVAAKHTTPDSELLTEGFYTLFCQRGIRPPAIFRDLQYISSLCSSSVLDSSSRGQAFWNAAAAAIRLKSEARKKLVETADNIIDYHTNNRGHGRSASTAQQQRDSATFTAPSRTPSAEVIAHYSMADAAHLLQITAREGDSAAQRELATLYLTHPELMDHVISPFALPGDVFRDEIEGRWKRDRDPERCDPRTMCVAHHWMVLGARGGDALAREFLRQREEMERLP